MQKRYGRITNTAGRVGSLLNPPFFMRNRRAKSGAFKKRMHPTKPESSFVKDWLK
jgi:hypothetical protein